MLPVIALIGRPNVGKSTLFNRLTKSRAALVADLPGLTRDRHYGRGRFGDQEFLVIDTGGFEPLVKDGILHEMARQTEQAVAEADVVIFVLDGRTGLAPQDRVIAERLRRGGRPVLLAVNKAEGMDRAVVAAEFHELAIGQPMAISAAHGEGVRELMDEVLADLPSAETQGQADEEGARVAIIGRPNVGKSTLVNTLLGEERVIAFDMPGTTRDAIAVPFVRGGRTYTLIDTAGLRRRGRVFEAVEKFSVIKTVQAAEQANVVILMLDATQEVSDQDAHIAGFALEAGRAMVVAVNKWDQVDHYRRELVKRDLERKLHFLAFARHHFISAATGAGIAPLLASVDKAHAAAMSKLATPRLTRVLQDAVIKQPPPRHGLARPKMRYAHQGGSNPPVIVVHGSSLEFVPDSYKRYLERTYVRAFKLEGTPVRVDFKSSRNPYT